MNTSQIVQINLCQLLVLKADIYQISRYIDVDTVQLKTLILSSAVNKDKSLGDNIHTHTHQLSIKVWISL